MLSLTRTQLDRLGSAQRKMLRNIVGWVRIDGEERKTTVRRMKQRMNNASRQFFSMPWKLQLHKPRLHYALRVNHFRDISWVEMISRSHPPDIADASLAQNPKCSVGRLRARLDDAIASFACASLDDPLQWLQLTDAFLIHCNIFL